MTNHEIGNASTHYFFIAFTPDGKGIANGGDKLQCWDVGFLIDRTRHGLNQTKKIFESNIGQVRLSLFHSNATDIKPRFLYNRGLSPMSPSLLMASGLFQAVGTTKCTSWMHKLVPGCVH